MDGASKLPRRNILTLYELRRRAEEIQGTLYLPTRQSQPGKEEIIISVSLASGPNLEAPEKQETGESRIWCDRLLLGGTRHALGSGINERIDDFYFPIFSVERQKRTFLTLLILTSETKAKITAPILEMPRRLPERILRTFGRQYSSREQAIYKLLIWSKLAQDKGISFSAFKQHGRLEIPRESWIVSDPWNQPTLARFLVEQCPNAFSELEWYQVTVVRKSISEETSSKQSGIAS